MSDIGIPISKPKPRHKAVRVTLGVLAVILVLALLAGALHGTEWLFVKVLAPLTQKLVYGVLGFDRYSPRGMALSFFIGILSKVMLLLTVLIFMVGYIRTYFSPARTRAILSGKNQFVAIVLAALLGIVTPFCTCSAIALFIGFIEAGIPLGVTLAFLISAPMINELAIGMLQNTFGWAIAGQYVGFGLAIAIASGWIIGKLNSKNLVEDWVYEIQMGNINDLDEELTPMDRVRMSWDNLKDILGRIWPFVAIGIAIAGAIYGGVPKDSFASFLGGDKWFSVPIAVLVGVPMYGNAGGAIPIMQVLLQKGAGMGTSLAFVMAMTGLSLPEMIVLRKVFKLKMNFIFVGVVTLGIVLVGYLFNYILR